MTDEAPYAQSETFDDGERSFTWAARSDVGRRRETNQDAFLAEYPMFVVADGMGGHAGGEIASAAVVDQLRALLPMGGLTTEAIEAALERAKEEIVRHPETTDEGTGTTLTGIFRTHVDGRARWVALNIGDSRVYQLRDGAIEQITTDHSVVQELIDSGRLRPEEADGHPYSNVITRAVGASEFTVPDYTALDPQDGDVFVICSDGLTKELTDYGIAHFAGAHPDPAEALAAMMTAALDNGGRDNVTLIVVRVSAPDLSSTEADSVE